MKKLMVIDPSLCIGCRGCQVACKQWNQLKAECTTCDGTYQNPPDLSVNTYTLVKFNELEKDGKVIWLFTKDQCRHCDEPGCLEAVSEEGAIVKDATGAVIFTDKMKGESLGKAAREGCPFDIPRFDKEGNVGKCTLCFDRVHSGLIPACAKTCINGAISFGDYDTMLAKAKERAKAIGATIYPGEEFHVIWLLTASENEHKIAELKKEPRKIARRKLLSPLAFLSIGAAWLAKEAKKG